MTAGYKPTDDDGLSEAWGEADRAALTPSQEPAVPSDDEARRLIDTLRNDARGGPAATVHDLDAAANWIEAALTAAPTPPAPEVERQQLRNAQAAAVMPLIGPLLDAWDGTDREVMSEAPELSKQLRAINNAMESAEAAAPTPPAKPASATSVEQVVRVPAGCRVVLCDDTQRAITVGPVGSAKARFAEWLQTENLDGLPTVEIASLAFDAGHSFWHETAPPPQAEQHATAPAAMNADLMQEAKTAIELAMDNLRSHGDNCFLHDDGEYDACFCGLDSLSDYLQSTVEAIDGAISAPAAEQPAVPESADSDAPVQLGELAQRNVYDAIRGAYDLGYNDARNARAVPGDSAPGYKGRNVEADHGGALLNTLNQRLRSATAQPAVPEDVAEALRDGLSVCRSVSTCRDRKIVRDGVTLYAQTEEWCRWLEDEVGPKIETALEHIDESRKAGGAA